MTLREPVRQPFTRSTDIRWCITHLAGSVVTFDEDGEPECVLASAVLLAENPYPPGPCDIRPARVVWENREGSEE